ncbi:hypothetical protein ACWGID_19200 [Kribbella sp. NPDC054772]
MAEPTRKATADSPKVVPFHAVGAGYRVGKSMFGSGRKRQEAFVGIGTSVFLIADRAPDINE